MIEWLKFTNQQRITSLEQAAVKSGISAKAIEKDWWVTLTLKTLFETPYAEFFIFKGGTSLSKGWKLIDRFSEDIDIALDPQAFGKEYQKNPSTTYVKNLKKEGCAFTSTVLLTALKEQFNKLQITTSHITIEAEEVRATIPDKDPQTIYVNYKSLYKPHEYIADVVKIEFSVRSLKEPYSNISIQSILSETLQSAAYKEVPFTIVAVEPQKTLLEKAFLLHEKFSKTETNNIKVERLSRHLYDLVKLMNAEPGKLALKDVLFYELLVEHRRNYIRLSGVDYDTLHYSTLSFIPPDAMMEIFRKDYQDMQLAMIYEASPDFDTIISQLKLLRGRFRMINEYKTLEEVVVEAEKHLVDHKAEDGMSGTASIPVTYLSDPYLPEGPNNKSIIFEVNFIIKDGKKIFDSIIVNQQKKSV